MKPFLNSVLSRLVIITLAANFCISAHAKDEAVLIPFEIVPFEKITERPKESEIVIIALVDSYQPEKASIHGPNDNTASQMLEGYLRGVRKLPNQENPNQAVQIDPEMKAKIKIFIVEGGTENRSDPTREKASELHTKLGLKDYDRAIPVIYLFHNGKIIETYTYHKSLGWTGGILAAKVTELLTKK